MCPQLRAWSRSIALLVVLALAAVLAVPSVAPAARPRLANSCSNTGDPLGGEKYRDEMPSGGGYELPAGATASSPAAVPLPGLPAASWPAVLRLPGAPALVVVILPSAWIWTPWSLRLEARP